MKYKSTKGFFLIEVVVASSIITVVLILLLGSIQNSVEASHRSLERTQVSYLLEEGAEATKAIRSDGWSDISSLVAGTEYYLYWDGSMWTFTTTPQVVDLFTRKIVFSNVNRDSNDDIVTSGGSLDSETKKVSITVSWITPSGTKSEDLNFYLTNI